jgi:hypothetical protein
MIVGPLEMNMRFLRMVSIATATLSLTACLNSATLIKVKPDGSGTIEQTMLMNVATLKGMMAGLDPQGQVKQSSTPFSEEQLRQAADKLGKGVRFVSYTPLKEANGFEGAQAVYAFDDINAINIEQDPNLGGAAPAGPGAAKKSNPVKFNLTRKGDSSVLTVTFDEKTTAGNAPATPPPTAPENVDPAMMQMIKQMFQGFKVAIDLEVLGKIVKTNADYVNGSRITLMEIDMAALLDDEAKLRALQTKMGPGASIADIKPLLKDVKGVKINHAVVNVEYR